LNNANKLVRAGWATTIGSWEMFQIVDAGGGLVAFKANANGNYVSSDMNITNQPAVAQWNAIGSWEKYTCQ
jgi:maltose-binding protein MalE